MPRRWAIIESCKLKMENCGGAGKQRLLIMGIVNITADSFSDGGDFLTQTDAVEHALDLAHEGADILDLGAESTRSGSLPINDATQIERLVPVIKAVRKYCDTPISIDTTSAKVFTACFNAGANIVNDISAGRFDKNMFTTAATLNAPIVLMHMQGTPQNMQAAPKYKNLVTEVYSFLQDRAKAAQSAGIAKNKIILDVGLGFGKTLAHNLELMQNLAYFANLGYPLLVGASRKGFLRKLLEQGGNLQPTNCDLDAATQATTVLAYQAGAQMVRVHNAAAAKAVLQAAYGILPQVKS